MKLTGYPKKAHWKFPPETPWLSGDEGGGQSVSGRLRRN
jgi:hypothetical protein